MCGPKSSRHLSLVRRVRRELEDVRSYREVRRVLVGLSGGVDSAVLLHLLAALTQKGGPEVVAAHVHHQTRKSADEDARVAEELSRRHGVEFHIVHLSRGGGRIPAEHLLRDARLSALERVADEVGAQRVALAHQRDDQAETLLLRFVTGSDVRGLRGIARFRPPLWLHPLLGISRAEIVAEAEGCGLSYVSDPTNRLTFARRNFVRRNIVPLLKAHLNPRLDEHLESLAASFAETHDYLTSRGRVLLRSARKKDGTLDREVFRKAHPVLRKRALLLAVEDLAGEGSFLARRQLAAMERFLLSREKSGEMELPHGLRFARYSGGLRLRQKH